MKALMSALLRPAKMATISIMMPASASAKWLLARATIFSIMKSAAASVLLLLPAKATSNPTSKLASANAQPHCCAWKISRRITSPALAIAIRHANLSLKLLSQLHANASQEDLPSLPSSKVFLATGAPPSKLMACSLPTTGSSWNKKWMQEVHVKTAKMISTQLYVKPVLMSLMHRPTGSSGMLVHPILISSRTSWRLQTAIHTHSWPMMKTRQTA